MEDLPNSNLQLVLGVKEGGNFDRIQKPTIIIATLNGHCRESKEIQSDCNPQYATDLTWDTDKNSLRKMRCNQTPVKIECYAVNDNGSREKVGYTLVSVRAAQIVPQDKESSIRTTWHDILGIRNDFSSCRPKLLLYLIIKERKEIKPDRNSISTSVDSYQVRDSNANDMPVWLEEEHLIQLGPPDTCKDIFLFSIVARAANNLVDSVSDYEMNSSCRISIIYHVFDSFFSLRPFESRLASTLLINEKIVVRMRSSFCALLNYLKSKSHFLIKMKVDGTFVGQSEINLESLVETNYIQSINKKTYGSASTKDYFCELRNTDSKRIEEGQKRGDVVTKAAGLEVHIRLQHVGTSNAMIENGQRVTYEPQPSVGFQRKPNHLDEKVNLTSVPYFCRNPDPSIYKEHHQIFNQKLTSSGENLEYPFINSPAHGMCNYPQNNPSKSFRTRTYRSYCLSVHLKAIKFFDPDPDLQKIEFRFYQPEGEIINKVCVNISVDAGQMVSLEDVNCKLYFITTTQEFEGFLETFCPRINVCNASSSVRKCLAQVNFDIRKFLLSKKNLLEYEAPMTSCRDKEKLGIISTSITLRECVATAHKNELNGYENPLKKVDDLDVWKKKQKESFLKELQRKEEAHLTLLHQEWRRRRESLESKLTCSVQQCKMLANNLSKMTENLRKQKIQSLEEEPRLIQENQELQLKYDCKLQELQSSLQKMHGEFTSQNRSLVTQINALLEKKNELEKVVTEQAHRIKTFEKASLNDDQTALVSLKLKNLGEKLKEARKSKLFFKEQWANAVRELHQMQIGNQRSLCNQIESSQKEMHNLNLEEILYDDSAALTHDQIALSQIQREIESINPELALRCLDFDQSEQFFAPQSDLCFDLKQSSIKSNIQPIRAISSIEKF